MWSASSYPGRVSREEGSWPRELGEWATARILRAAGPNTECRARQERTRVQVHVASSETRDLQYMQFPFIYIILWKGCLASVPFLYLLMAALGLSCWPQVFSSCGEEGLLSSWCVGFSLRWILLFQSTGSVAEADGISCPTACRILLDQEMNPYLLHWQAESLPLSPQGNPIPLHFQQVSKLIVTLGNRCYKSPVKLV